MPLLPCLPQATCSTHFCCMKHFLSARGAVGGGLLITGAAAVAVGCSRLGSSRAWGCSAAAQTAAQHSTAQHSMMLSMRVTLCGCQGLVLAKACHVCLTSGMHSCTEDGSGWQKHGTGSRTKCIIHCNAWHVRDQHTYRGMLGASSLSPPLQWTSTTPAIAMLPWTSCSPCPVLRLPRRLHHPTPSCHCAAHAAHLLVPLHMLLMSLPG
jgi:hypothetical protein